VIQPQLLISAAYARARRATLLRGTRGKPRLHEVSWNRGDHQKASDISPEYWVVLGAAVSILSLLVAGFSLIYVRRSAKALRERTKQQKQAAKDAAQPMLWVDIRGDDSQGQALVQLLGNPGPSIARHVKLTFDPAPPFLTVGPLAGVSR
jgi:hypothetical protein